jgi:hypothetical protein
MGKIYTGIIIGIVLGVALFFSIQQAMLMNARVTGIEKFLQNAISQSQKAQPQAVKE